MSIFQNRSGPHSYGEISWKDGYIGKSSRTLTKELTGPANQYPIDLIIRKYVKVLDNERKIICPLPKHQEESASFYWYPKTNTFHCYGCKAGSTVVDFVAQIEGISKLEAAQKINSLIQDPEILVEYHKDIYFNEKLELNLQFSNTIREYRKLASSNDDNSFIEDICKIFDDLNIKYELTHEGLSKTIDLLTQKIQKRFNV